MGACIAPARASALHDANRRPVPLEFSMAAMFSSDSCNLRGGGPAFKAGVTEPGYSCAGTRRFDERRRIGLPYGWFVRFSAHLDFHRTGCGLVLVRIPVTQFQISTVVARCRHILRVTRDVSLHADKPRSSQI